MRGLSILVPTAIPVLFAFLGDIAFLGLSVSHTTDAWMTTTSITKRHPSTGRIYKSSVTDTTVTTTTETAEIIGNGRIGSFLAKAGNCRVLSRNDAIDPNNEGNPIYIATRNDALESIVDNCPINRRQDLVFLQNGYLDDFLSSKGLLENTQVLLYLSVPSMGAIPIDGITSYNPEGLTMVTGKHDNAFAQRLTELNMKCIIVDPTTYRPAMFEKLIWICTYMLVGTANECKSVGQAGSEYNELITQVIVELMNAVEQQNENVIFPDGTIERLSAYTDVVKDFPCGVKEFTWRNQYFYNLSSPTTTSTTTTTPMCPIHNGLLQECQAKGYLSFDLPPN